MAKTTIAKYDGRCKACGRYHIRVGDKLQISKKGWAHVDCCYVDMVHKAKYDELRREAKARGMHLYDYLNGFKNKVAADVGGTEDFY